MNSETYDLSPASHWILKKYIHLLEEIDLHTETYELGHAVESIYKFLWDYYADWYVEYLKTDDTQITFAKKLYREFIISTSPFIPFEAEVLWKEYFGENQLLSHYVQTNEFLDAYKHSIDDQSIFEFESIITFVSSLRSTRGLFAIDPGTPINIYSTSPLLARYSDFMQKNSKSTLIKEDHPSLYFVTSGEIEYSINILDYIKDKLSEIERTNKIILDLTKQKQILESQLSNQGFLSNADQKAIKDKQSNLHERTKEIENQQNKLAFLTK